MRINNRKEYIEGFLATIPLVPSFVIFGLILGFTASNGGLDWLTMASTGIIIFAGSAQFLTIILLIDNDPLIIIAITAIVLNLRHLLYGAVMNKLFPIRKRKHLGLAYFLTDETFLLTQLHAKSREGNTQEQLEAFFLGSGITLWSLWNISMTLGYFIGNLVKSISIPDNFIIASTFVGYLVNHWQKFPGDRSTLIFSTITVFALNLLRLDTSSMLLFVMVLGAGYASFEAMLKNRRQSNE